MDAQLENAEITAITIQQLIDMTNNFSEERKIGSGGFATVYKGVQRDGRAIAVKLLFQNLQGLDDTYFLNELNNHMRLKHQNIVRLLAYCHHTEGLYVEYQGKHVLAEVQRRALRLEYAINGSLDRFLTDEHDGLDWSTRYRIIRGTCEGLKYLHYGLKPGPILHLNIKPDNILLDDNMEPKIEGFALSRLCNDEDEIHIYEDLLRTRGYMPPEYIDQGLASKKFDIYSLGVVKLEIVAGPKAHYRSFDMPRQDFIDLVYVNWRSRLRLRFTGSTLDAYCEQVKICTMIALSCMEIDRYKRPDIVDITLTLSETETHKGFKEIQEWKISYEKMKTITNNFRTEELGGGAFGTVYKGELANGEIVAVKRLHHYSANQRKQIESEEHLKNLEHGNIVRLIGYCHETIKETVPDPKNPGKYMVQDVTVSLLCYEFLSNGSLEDKLWKDTSSRLDWKTCYSVIQGICKGLHYLHHGCKNAPIVHRDLKPGNVLLDHNMLPKLGDFGLSRIVPKTQAHITMAVGSSGYMAPETVNDTKSSKITPASDMYSSGVLILEIVTGDKCPHDEYSGKRYIEKVREARKQNSYVTSRYPSLEGHFLQQVESWISIGLRCVEELPERRPTIEHIMHFLETESANLAETIEGEASKMSFKELEDITNFSPRYGESIFGSVYEGRRVNGDDVIVIKLKEQKILAPAQFKSEVNRMNYEHKNILQLKGYCGEIHGVEVRERFLCYEFFREGSLLGGIIYGDAPCTQLDWEARYKIILGICQALKYLHEECEDGPQVHMGITPTNIWLDNEMVPKLGACGVSRLFATDWAHIYNKETVEFRGYMAPEHVELTKMSTKSDIYSLGVLIMEIVTGLKCPSSDNGSAASFIANVQKTWMKDLHVASKYPSLDAGSLQQVKGCIKIGVQCAEISPEKRPTAGEIISMLEKECTGKPTFWNALCGICTKA